MAESTLELSTEITALAAKAPIRVLHVDDEQALLKVSQECLQLQGEFEVDTASSVKEAAEKMMKKAYDAVVCDYQMPEKDGLQFLAELKESGNTIPFILFTGKGREEVAAKAVNLGAEGYVDKNGDPETVYCELAHRIRKAVERIRAEDKLKVSEERYRSLFKNAYNCILLLDLKGNILDVNDVILEYGFKKEELIGRNVTEFVPWKEKLRLIKEIAKKATGKSAEGKIEINTPKGKILADYVSKPIIVNNRVVGTQTILSSVSEQKEMAVMYQAVFENTGAATCIIEEDNTILLANKQFEKLSGYSKEEIEGKKKLIDFVTKKYLKKMEKYHDERRRKRGKAPNQYLFDFVNKKGEIRTALVTVDLIPGTKKSVASLIDVTEQKQLMMQLRELEESYRCIFAQAPVGIITFDVNGVVKSANDTAMRLLEFSEEEIVGKHFSELKALHQKDAHEFTKLHECLLKGLTPKPFEVQYFRKDGSVAFGEVYISLIREKGKVTGFQAITLEITERKKTEESLRISEEACRALINGMNDTAWVIGFDGKFIEVNDSAVKVLGYSKEELLHMGPADIDNSLTKEQILNLIRNMPADHIQVFETTHTTKDGKTIPVEISSSLVTYKGKKAILSIARNITERKEAEEKLNKLMNELVLTNEKLGVVGKWTRHDARNKLSVIKSNVYLAKKKLPSNHPALKYLDEIDSACGHITKIFDFAATYEMLGAEERVYTDVEKSFEEAAALVSGLGDVKIENRCRGLIVLADTQLRQIFYNLIDNSLKHGEKVSQISMYYKEDEASGELKLVYEDNGVGISDDAKRYLFREGFGKGTGYGLYLMAKLCNLYGWIIQETGETGKGAQFTITIPKRNAKGDTLYQLKK